MKIKFYSGLFILILIFVCGRGNGQSPDWLWAESIGGVGYDVATSIVLDGSGNIYTTGYFVDTVDFDPGPGVCNLTSSSISIFISKCDNAGNFIWAKSIGGTNLAYGFSIALDNAGYVYTTGFFQGTCDFNPDTALTFNLITVHEATFISKLDNGGNFVWAKSMNGSGDQRGHSIALDDSANVFVTGYFSGTTDFDPDTGSYSVTSNGFLDIYISKMDSSGNFVWNGAFGGLSGDEGFCLDVDHYGNVITKGNFSGTIDFDPGPGTYNLIAPQGSAFLCKLDNDGNFIMASAIGSLASSFRDRSFAVDGSGNMYLTGGFNITCDFDPDSIGVFNLTSNGNYDIFLAKYDSMANFIWAKGMGSTSADFGGSIALDIFGNIYFTGTFIGDVDMDTDSGVFILHAQSGGYRDNFISEFDNSGNFLWAKEVGGTNSNLGCNLALDSNVNIYLAGSYYLSPFSIGPYTFINTDTTLQTSNIFIGKLDTLLINGNVEVVNSPNKISIYPNPASDNFTVDLGNKHLKATIIISDLTGNIVFSASKSEIQKSKINTAHFSAGIYLVQIKSDDFIETKKLIISK